MGRFFSSMATAFGAPATWLKTHIRACIDEKASHG